MGPAAIFHLSPMRAPYFIMAWLVARFTSLDGFGVEKLLPVVLISSLVAEVYIIALKLTNNVAGALIAAGQFMVSYYSYRLFLDLHSALFGYVMLLLWYAIYISSFPKGNKRIAVLGSLIMVIEFTYPIAFLIVYAILLFQTVIAMIFRKELVLESAILLIIPLIPMLAYVTIRTGALSQILDSLFRGPDWLAPFPSDSLRFYLYLGQDSWLYALIVPFLALGLYQAIKLRLHHLMIWVTALPLMLLSAYYMNTTLIPERVILFFPSYLLTALAANSIVPSASESIRRSKRMRLIRIRSRAICRFMIIIILLLVAMVAPYDHAKENISSAPVYINQTLVEKLQALQLYMQSKNLTRIVVIADLDVVGLSYSLVNNTIHAVIRNPVEVYFGKFNNLTDRLATKYNTPVFNYISAKSLISVLQLVEGAVSNNQEVTVVTFPEIYNLNGVHQCLQASSFCVLGYLP